MATKSKLTDIKLPILKPENYTEWKIKITSLLKAKELYEVVQVPLADLKAVSDNDKTADDGSIEQLNEEAKSVIYSSLDGKATQAAGVCEDAYVLWTKVLVKT